jgi:hypothetical protein
MIKKIIKLTIINLRNSVERIKTSYTEGYHEKILVDIKDCTSINGFAFGEGWHFLVETLNQYRNNKNIRYDETALAKYYEYYQPQNLLEALFGEDASDNDLLSLKKFRDPQNAPMPWTPMNLINKKFKNNQGDYGPKDRFSNYGIQRMERLIKIHNNINENGFNEEEYSDVGDHIKGIMLKNSNEYRFLVVNGNHRIAALSALGYQKVMVRSCKKFPAIIDVENIKNWPCVKKGIYSETTAEKIFMHYFEQNGLDKAKNWGIM